MPTAKLTRRPSDHFYGRLEKVPEVWDRRNSPGKKFMVSATWNAQREAFNNPDGLLFGSKGTDDLSLSITSNYRFCGFDILPDFGVSDIFRDTDIPAALAAFKRRLGKYCLPGQPE